MKPILWCLIAAVNLIMLILVTRNFFPSSGPGHLELARALDKLDDNEDRAPQIIERLRARGHYVRANRIESALKRGMFVEELLQHVEDVLSRCDNTHPRFAARLRAAYGLKGEFAIDGRANSGSL